MARALAVLFGDAGFVVLGGRPGVHDITVWLHAGSEPFR